MVAAAGVMVVQRRRRIGTELTVGRDGSRMDSRGVVVTAAKIMAVQWKRWTKTGAAWAVQVAGYTPRTGKRRRGIKRTNFGNGGGRVAKGNQGHRAWPMVLAVHLPLTAGDDGDRHSPGH